MAVQARPYTSPWPSAALPDSTSPSLIGHGGAKACIEAWSLLSYPVVVGLLAKLLLAIFVVRPLARKMVVVGQPHFRAVHVSGSGGGKVGCVYTVEIGLAASGLDSP